MVTPLEQVRDLVAILDTAVAFVVNRLSLIDKRVEAYEKAMTEAKNDLQQATDSETDRLAHAINEAYDAVGAFRKSLSAENREDRERLAAALSLCCQCVAPDGKHWVRDFFSRR